MIGSIPFFCIFVRTQFNFVRKTCIILHFAVPLQREVRLNPPSQESVRHSYVKDIFLICFSRLVFK